jgi:hypothetical protein
MATAQSTPVKRLRSVWTLVALVALTILVVAGTALLFLYWTHGSELSQRERQAIDNADCTRLRTLYWEYHQEEDLVRYPAGLRRVMDRAAQLRCEPAPGTVLPSGPAPPGG